MPASLKVGSSVACHQVKQAGKLNYMIGKDLKECRGPWHFSDAAPHRRSRWCAGPFHE